MISFYIWYVFFVRVVTNLHLYLICLLNVVGCGFIFVFDLASECGWLWIYGPTWLLVSKWEASRFFSVTRCQRPTRITIVPALIISFFIPKRLVIRGGETSHLHHSFPVTKCQRPFKIDISFQMKTWYKVNILDAGQICQMSDAGQIYLLLFLEEHSSWI